MVLRLCAVALLGLFASIDAFSVRIGSRYGGRVSSRNSYLEMAAEGGKIVVSGIGKLEEDEFMLNLLNEQVSLAAHLSFLFIIL